MLLLWLSLDINKFCSSEIYTLRLYFSVKMYGKRPISERNIQYKHINYNNLVNME